MYPKRPPFRSESWRRAVASLPCVVCFREGPSQAAHANHLGKGMGMKASDCFTVPMCPEHHAEFDQGRTWSKQEKREMMERWILLTLEDLAREGLVGAK